MAMAEGYSADRIRIGRENLTVNVLHNKDTSAYIQDLIMVDVPLIAKFRELNFCDILKRNSQSAESLKKLVMGMNILEKYGRHLLKPAESRSNMWRHIKYNNSIYSNRVDKLQGGREIMHLMGYSESMSDGVAFPENGEPDQDKVLNLVVDIIVGRKELETYLNGNHPYPSFIEDYIAKDIVDRQKSDSAEKAQEKIPTTNYTVLDFQPTTLPALSLMKTMSMQNTEPVIQDYGNDQGLNHESEYEQQLSGHPQGSGFPQQGKGHPQGSGFQQHGIGHPQGSGFQQQEYGLSQSPGISQRGIGQLQGPGPSQQGMGHSQDSGIPQQGIGHPQASGPSQQGMSHPQGPGIPQQGMGHPQASGIPQQGMGLTQVGLEEVSKKPVLNIDLKQPAVAMPVNANQGVTPEEVHTPSIACDICGDNRADVICLQCDSKQLCNGCDFKWHKHPKRQNHKVDLLRPADNAKLNHQELAIKTSQQHDSNATFQGPNHSFTPQKALHQDQQQRFERPHNYQEFPAHHLQNYHGMNQQQQQQQPQQQYFVHGVSYSLQPYGQIREGNEGVTLMVDPASGQHYEVSSMPQGQRYDMPTVPQPPQGRQNLNAIHDQRMTDNRHQQFLIPQNHGIPTSQSNFQGQRYVPAGNMYQPLSSSGIHIHSGSDTSLNTSSHINPYLHTTPGTRVSREGGAITGVGPYTPPTPSVLSSPGTPIVSPISNLFDERNYISSGSRRSVMSTNIDRALAQPLMSKLLPKIKLIPDPEKQKSRLEIDLMNLKEDVTEWDKKINEIIIKDQEFLKDEKYISLNKKKRRHLHEIKVLESYQEELEKVIAESREEVNKDRELETYRRLAMQNIQAIKKQDMGPPGSPTPHQDTLTSDCIRPPVKQHGDPQRNIAVKTLKGPERSTYQPGNYLSNERSELAQSTEDPPGLKLASLEMSEIEGIPEDVRRMLVLDQSPFDNQIKPKHSTFQQMNFPVEPKRNTDVAYPPNVGVVDNDLNTHDPEQRMTFPVQNIETPSQNKRVVEKKTLAHLSSANSAPDLQQVQHKNQPNQSKSMSAGPQWECEHCTLINDADVKACRMCFKTSDNPKILIPKEDNPPINIPVETQEATVHCKHCTFLNKKGYTICEMCGEPPSQLKVMDNIDLLPNQLKVKDTEESSTDRSQVKDKDVVVKEYRQAGDTDNIGANCRGLDDIIRNDQDQIYLEKKAAQEQFDRNNKNENWSGSSRSQLTLIETDPVNAVKGAIQSKVPSGVSENTDSDKFETARTSLNTSQEEVEPINQPNLNVVAEPVNKGFKGSPDFTKTIEQIQLKREQEQMGLDSHDLMAFVKMAEKSDFNIEEVMIALQHSQEDEMKPLNWLKDKWNSMIETVEKMSTEKGQAMTQNDVGDVSKEEARRALLHSKGDVEEAVRKCVEDRQAMYKMITECGQYACEEIQTALLQNDGDVEEALDQLNQSVIQAYIDRLWDTENKLLGRMAILSEAASRMDDLNNSVSNSIVNNEGFQAIIKDMTVDRQRRIRMVFVEGKLVSWGRADLVISILEQNVIQSDDPLDCTLEDIIDAVRNCGERKSSLVYLKQECGTCMSYYPMSKIRSLGVCDCKLCETCLKQYFEIAIREKFVRNWGCPICDAPGIGNDETNAADYFDFLHLVLDGHVSREVIDLYDTKLRDWHLQKDPNFRWCAHCAFGFIWDRPDALGMTCQQCRGKTCFSCKIMWENQHQDLTCEEFAQWKIDNDPEKQAMGVKMYLEENGIDCPSCKMRYSLAKGGCMHFKCPQCGHEFCSGCSQPFKQQEACRELNSCRNKGLHCHHPRDCFYYLRDRDVGDLQKLLKKHQVRYNTDIPHTQVDKHHCPVEEQKEFGAQKKDEACGKELQKGYAGLCESHYKEYLVGLINMNKIDPVTVLKMTELRILIERNEKVFPEVRPNETEAQFRSRVIQFIKERFKLHR